ncbi:bifunctional adenosylcobinamide kinase/adenosylcobinamide-phosphate guanylyltransferase [Nitrosomonas marina]|uniref:Bifunctional adenosylcobalamin biosynthesis protein n=1 Tax=Nitrosomonas marina TaxID=917 RepID=A0A1H8INR0_9PROT|nr:bifunctional adenosylcobinamide kinase/adenosylcobinamide-phosphate guanylyltransferase [Nitrosomonas marina]SEN70353.1 adenosylcobinamide kinase /adenosylcobinamide-phosphate guanylyltransferase [Nitrosomonas marina]
MDKTLILGGIRSGKSRMAEKLAIQTHLPVTYIATATSEDDEMQARIALHRANRPKHWYVIEEPVYLADTLQQNAETDKCILVDCLTLWLTNLLLHEDDTLFERQRMALLSLLPQLPGPVILVSNETSMGVVPMGELTRRYCEEAGKLHQLLAQQCQHVILTIAGLPHFLKGGIRA